MPKKKYDVKIEVNSQVLTTKTDDILAALEALEIKSPKTRVVVTVSWKDKTFSRVFMGRMARMLLNNKLTAKLFAQNVYKTLS